MYSLEILNLFLDKMVEELRFGDPANARIAEQAIGLLNQEIEAREAVEYFTLSQEKAGVWRIGSDVGKPVAVARDGQSEVSKVLGLLELVVNDPGYPVPVAALLYLDDKSPDQLEGSASTALSRTRGWLRQFDPDLADLLKSVRIERDEFDRVVATYRPPLGAPKIVTSL